MLDSPLGQVVLHAAIERDGEPQPGPDQALRWLLAAHPLAPGLLSEARHRAVVARRSEAEAVRAARSARDAELGYELARRMSDPRGTRNLSLGLAVVTGCLLLGVVGAVSLSLWQDLPRSDRVVLTLATMTVCGALAWAAARQGQRRGMAWLAVAGLALGLVFVRLREVTSGAAVAVWIAQAVLLGLALVMAVAIAVLVLERVENIRCCRLRRARQRAASHRERISRLAFADESAAIAARAAWESLVVEECQLARPSETAGNPWVTRCIEVARLAATP